MVVRRPWRQGLQPVPGSWKLMAMRWVLFVGAALPALGTALGGIAGSVGDRPYFTEAPDPLPLLPLIRLLDEMPGAIWGMLVLTAAAAWLGQLMLTAGAVAVFGTAGDRRPLVWRTVVEAGTRSLWAYLRIALGALLVGALGARIIGLVSAAILEHGQDALWTMRAQFFLQVGRALATLCWLLVVGVFAWWCRLILVADQRRRVRRLWSVVPRLWWRRPAALVGQFLLALVGLLAGTVVLFAWRQSPSGGGGWAVVWLLVLAGLSFLWHWRLRAGRLLWSSPDLLDLRAVPDAPWGLRERLFRRSSKRPRQPAATPGASEA